jgi:hypothetical protein
MKYRVTVVDGIMGVIRHIDVEAESESDALRIAKEQGVQPYEVSRVLGPSPQIPPAQISQPRYETAAESKLIEQTVSAVIVGGLALVLLWKCSNFFNSISNTSPTPSSNYNPPQSYHYDHSSDEKLRNLPSLRGYSNSEKDQIISEAKKFDAAVKALEQKRGY